MNAIYPAAAGAGGFAFRHHAPPWRRAYDDLRADLERDLKDAFRDKQPTPAAIKDRLVAFVERYVTDRTVIDVRRDPDDPTKLIVERRIALPPQLETIP